MAALLAATGCTFPRPANVDEIDATDAPVLPDFAIGGTVRGLWTGAAVVLELTAAPDPPSLTTVDADGAFTLDRRLIDGRSFAVTVAANGQPFMHACVVTNGAGRVQGTDVTDLDVVCTVQADVAIALSAPLPFTFDRNVAVYTPEAAIGVQETRVTVVAPAATHLRLSGDTIVGEALTNAVASGPAPLRFGETVLHVDVTIAPISQRYTITIDRTSGPIVALGSPVYGKASNTGDGDRFGASIAASGALVAVGAPDEDGGGTGVDPPQEDESRPDAGAVYVFRRNGLGWVQEAYLKPSVVAAGDRFGASVSLYEIGGAAAVLVVGAPGDDGTATDSGAAYVFRRSAAGWRFEQRIKAPLTRAGDAFGTSVAVALSQLVVGAPAYDQPVADGGAAFAYHFTSAVWQLDQRLDVPAPDTGDELGARVAIVGDVYAVAAPGEDSAGRGVDSGQMADDGAPDSGAVTIFTGPLGALAPTAYLKAPNADPGDRFGAALAFAGDLLVVGAEGEDSGSTDPDDDNLRDAGAAYVLRRTGSTWVHEAYLKAAVPGTSHAFGGSLAVRRDLVFVGTDEPVSQINGSSAALFLHADTWSAALPVPAPDLDDGDRHGAAAALGGEGLFVTASHEDGDGRGFSGSPADDSSPDSGAWYTYY